MEGADEFCWPVMARSRRQDLVVDSSLPVFMGNVEATLEEVNEGTESKTHKSLVFEVLRPRG